MKEDLLIVNSEVIEKTDDNGLMRKFLRIFFYDVKRDEVITKERIINGI